MRRLQTKCVCLLLTLATLAVPQALLADTEWKVESTTEGTKTTFTVTRSGDISEPADVYYRTISLSAMAVYNFQAMSGKWLFTAGETSKSVTVSELTASYDAFKYQVGAKRRYGFEVTDWEGVRLAYCERAMSTGSAIPADAFNEKHVDVITSQVTVTDGGYEQGYQAVNLNKFFTADGQRNYYTYTGAEVYMTVSMNVSEKNDGYQYIAVLVNNTDGYDMNAGSGRPYDTDATVGYISMRASYMAGFGHNPGSQSGTAASYSFPVRDPKGNITGGVEKPWSSLGNSVGKLYTQVFKDGYEASDGRILLPLDISTLGLRFDGFPLTAASAALVGDVEHARPSSVRLLPDEAHYAQPQILGDPALVEVVEPLRRELLGDNLASLRERRESAGFVWIVGREVSLARLPHVLVLVPVGDEAVYALAPEVLGLFPPHGEPGLVGVLDIALRNLLERLARHYDAGGFDNRRFVRAHWIFLAHAQDACGNPVRYSRASRKEHVVVIGKICALVAKTLGFVLGTSRDKRRNCGGHHQFIHCLSSLVKEPS